MRRSIRSKVRRLNVEKSFRICSMFFFAASFFNSAFDGFFTFGFFFDFFDFFFLFFLRRRLLYDESESELLPESELELEELLDDDDELELDEEPESESDDEESDELEE